MKRLNISQVDALFSNGAYPIEFLLFYENGVDTEAVRRAFRELSAPFWPLFGQYDRGQIVFEGYREDACFDAEVRAEAFDAGKPNQLIHNRYRHEIPPAMKRLFFLKVIQHENGTALVAKINHVAGDGYSYFYFLSALAELTRGALGAAHGQGAPSFPEPHHDRTVLREFALGDLEPEPLGDTSGPTLAFLEVPRAAVQERIQHVADAKGQRVSTNDVLAALAIQRLATVGGGQAPDAFRLTVPIDVRREIREFGHQYFGNGLMYGRIPFRRSEVGSASLEEIAVAIRQGMPKVSTGSYTRYLEELELVIHARQPSRLRPYDPAEDCLVTNLSRLPSDQLDFGSGTPSYVLPLTIGRNSAAVLGDRDQFVLRLEH
ncbi:MAG: hypothetical protein IH608_03785 [Proteobacteria bacterium]|nr:hypothetical protein [Pseudomonadota bacterium]